MTFIFDPTVVPLLGHDHDLPPVDPARLGARALRERFAQPPRWSPETQSDRVLVGGETAPAAVLVPLITRHEPTVLLTRRTPHLKAHAGQIAFPGGRVEPGDADAVHTALREAHEEIGLPGERVEVIGTLPTYTTITGFVVTPVVGLIEPGAVWQPDPNEVEEVFEVPLAYLMNPAHHQRRGLVGPDGTHQFFAMPWVDPASQAGREYFIWGATAAMLRNLYRFLQAPPPV